jgi:hypothetical protein
MTSLNEKSSLDPLQYPNSGPALEFMVSRQLAVIKSLQISLQRQNDKNLMQCLMRSSNRKLIPSTFVEHELKHVRSTK